MEDAEERGLDQPGIAGVEDALEGGLDDAAEGELLEDDALQLGPLVLEARAQIAARGGRCGGVARRGDRDGEVMAAAGTELRARPHHALAGGARPARFRHSRCEAPARRGCL